MSNAAEENQNPRNTIISFNSSNILNLPSIPREFVWPQSDRQSAVNELQAPVIDLHDFLRGDGPSSYLAVELARSACVEHGLFQVTNHGVDYSLMRDAMDCIDEFFKLPLASKQKIYRNHQLNNWGYARAHSDRFITNLPWKETLSFGYDDAAFSSSSAVTDYFVSTLGDEFRKMGAVYQKYCEAMTTLSLSIMELLGLSLGVNRSYFREYFNGGNAIMRCNYYPKCQEPELTFGTGPHSDPTSITILQQDEVSGLEVLSAGEWQVVKPVTGALVVNIGDTFMALSNGIYKSCVHRAVVNKEKERRTLVFFFSPKENKVVSPPGFLVNNENPRKYPDFTWAELYDFTQNHYRVDMETMSSFIKWLPSPSSSSRNTSLPICHG